MGSTGRPRLFNSPEEMQEGIDAYFKQLNGKVPTVAGICFFLGFDDRHALAQYEEYDGFSATVKKARLRIEQDRAERLIGKDTFTPGIIFDLKNNHGWKDKTEVDQSIDVNLKAQSDADRFTRSIAGIAARSGTTEGDSEP